MEWATYHGRARGVEQAPTNELELLHRGQQNVYQLYRIVTTQSVETT